MWTYETTVNWSEGKKGETGSDGKPGIGISTPPEFGGPEGFWTPEDLLTSSVASCVLTSTLFFAEKGGIGLRSYKSKSTGTMEKTPAGLAITGVKIEVSIELEDAGQEAEIRKAVERAEKTCPISNSLKCPVEVALSVS